MPFLGFGLKGEGKTKAGKAGLGNIANAQYEDYQQYYRPALAHYADMAKNPGSDPYAAQLQQNAYSDLWKAVQNKSGLLSRAAQSGGYGQSSQAMQGQYGLGNAYTDTMRKLATDFAGQQQQRADNYWAQMANMANPQGAQASYQGYANIGQQETANAMQNINGIAQLAGMYFGGGFGGLGKVPVSTGGINPSSPISNVAGNPYGNLWADTINAMKNDSLFTQSVPWG